MRKLIILFLFPLVMTAQTAFYGAVGFGKNATGGKGGIVYHVTNKNDSGIGSLRYGVETVTGARTIVFDVSGEIYQATPLRINQGRGNITIAGQTSPSGITLTHSGIWVSESNVIIRHLKIRPGKDAYNPGNLPPSDPNYEPDDGISIKGFTGYDLEDIYLDHITVSWAHDGLIDITNFPNNATTYTRDITVANCMFYENVDKGYGMLINHSNNVTYYRNVMAFTTDRNIAISSHEAQGVEMINNFMYATGRTTWYREGNVNDFIGNIFISGNYTNAYETFKMEASTEGNDVTLSSIYQEDNYEDGVNEDAVYGRAVGYKVLSPNYNNSTPIISSSLVESTLIGEAGASLFYDASDNRVIAHINNRTGYNITDEDNVGGYPTVGTTSRSAGYDTDNDGMSDVWETSVGLNPNVADNNGDYNSDGFTNLQKFLSFMADDSSNGTPTNQTDTGLNIGQKTFNSILIAN